MKKICSMVKKINDYGRSKKETEKEEKGERKKKSLVKGIIKAWVHLGLNELSVTF